MSFLVNSLNWGHQWPSLMVLVNKINIQWIEFEIVETVKIGKDEF